MLVYVLRILPIREEVFQDELLARLQLRLLGENTVRRHTAATRDPDETPILELQFNTLGCHSLTRFL